MGLEMQPDLLKRREGTQLSYHLPHRVYATRVYPRRAPNGSVIILYAHEQGLRIVWYGGKKFKQASQERSINGDSIDLTNTPADGEQEFENDGDEGEQDDGLESISGVLTFLDVPLGTACSHIAILPFLTDQPLDDHPSFLDSQIMIAVAGLDQSLKIVMIPLQPTQKPNAAPQVIDVKQTSSHQDLILDIAITLTAEAMDEEDFAERSRSRSRPHSVELSHSPARIPAHWSVLLSSISSTGYGLLLVHQIPIDHSGNISQDPEDYVSVQKHHLRSLLAQGRLRFSPSMYPAEHHSYLLLTTADGAGVKVFQTLPQTKYSRRRRGSTATTDSTLSAARSIAQVSSVSGKCLITLLPPFAPYIANGLSPRRKRVLDASWALQGRAIVVLLEDGEWGVWDLEAAGPVSRASSNNLVKGQKNVSGIHGGSLTKFATGGFMDIGHQSTKRAKSTSASNADTSLAPMTPHTRRARSQDLFKGSEQPTSVSSSVMRSSKGHIFVSAQRDFVTSEGRTADESIFLSHDSINVMIPSLQAYWRSGISSRSTFDNTGVGRPVTLPQVAITDEEQLTAELMPAGTSHTGLKLMSATQTPGFVVSSASKLVMFIPNPPLNNKSQPATLSSLPMRLTAARASDIDQTMLESGELGLDGVDRMLDNMAHGSVNYDTSSDVLGKRANGIQFVTHNDDEDDDVDMMGSPTLPRSGKSKLVVSKENGSRRLFA